MCYRKLRSNINSQNEGTRRYEMSTTSAMLELARSFVLTTENLGRGYGSWQAAEIQITRAHEGGVHFEQRRRDDTWLFVKCGPSITLTFVTNQFLW